MTPLRVVLTFFDRDFLKLVLVLLAYSVIPLGEILLFVYLSSIISIWWVIVLAGVIGVAGASIGLAQAHRNWARLKGMLASASYAGSELVEAAGLTVAGLLLVSPGFFTDFVGFLLLIPAVRAWAGRRFASAMRMRSRAVYDRLKLSSL